MRRQLVTGSGLAISLRPERGDDGAFLHALYADRRAAELDALGLGPRGRRAFVDLQFRAQQAGYEAEFSKADRWVVLIDEEPVGRLLVDRQARVDRVVDVALLGRHRGRGIGAAVLGAVMEAATGAGRTVALTVVAHDRRLLRWYHRLGFRPGDAKGPHLEMTWRPDPTRRG